MCVCFRIIVQVHCIFCYGISSINVLEAVLIISGSFRFSLKSSCQIYVTRIGLVGEELLKSKYKIMLHTLQKVSFDCEC